MDRSEPALVPAWLKNSGSATVGGSTSNQFSSSSLHSDDFAASKHTRNKSSSGINEGCVLDRTTSSYFRRNSVSTGSSHLRPYNSFGRSHRDRDWERDSYDCHEKNSVLGDQRHRDFSDPLGSVFPTGIEKDVIRRPQSLTVGKQNDVWPKKLGGDLNNASKNSILLGNNVVSSVQKSIFERDFPTLGAEDRQNGSEIGRVASPGLSSPLHSLPASISGDGWKSALAEVPGVVGSNSAGAASSQQIVSVSSASSVSSMTTGLNMAEALAQGSSRARTPPQVSVETQRREELVKMQSARLIPMTPKAGVHGSSEKSKSKIAQQHVSHVASQSLREGPARLDFVKASGGKFKVLSPKDLNGVSSSSKDSVSPRNGSQVMNSSSGVVSSPAACAQPRSSKKANSAIAEHKPVIFTAPIDRRPTSQVQSRNDFFNLLKKKACANSTNAEADTGHALTTSIIEKSDKLVADNASASVVQDGDAASLEASKDLSTGNEVKLAQNGNASDGSLKPCSNGKSHSGPAPVLCPDEEEAAFLRSLGWEENAEEDEGLTEEEIAAFYEEYLKLKPSSKLLQEMCSKIALSLNSRVGGCSDGALGSSSTDSGLES